MTTANTGSSVLPLDARTIASVMGGKVERGRALVPGPGHSLSDRSLSVKPDRSAPKGFADERAQVAMYASLSRIIESAPVENKMRVFGLMAQTAAADAAAYRQQMIDDLWFVAADLGLVAMIGTAMVQNTLVIAFPGSAL
jgi:hypothetical protein